MPTLCTKDIILRDLEPGDEVLDNYNSLVTTNEKRRYGQWLATLCAVGDAEGSVFAYEQEITDGSCNATQDAFGGRRYDDSETYGTCRV